MKNENEFDQGMFRLRVGGREYGPFTEEKIRGWLDVGGRKVSDEDSLWDPAVGAWTPLASWLPEAKKEEPGALEEMLSAPRTYARVTKAGLILVLFWASLFVGFRLYTGKWPMRGGTHHRGRTVAVQPTETESPK